MSFNQNKYINEYKKKHYKEFRVLLKIDEYDKLMEYLKKNNLTKKEYLLNYKKTSK